ncbi:hypothetical protein ACCO45_007613 [Purpureocillium lilacinum]|uniref:Uncharacterized protein n=1 Tax=Purpureocillium lilacinum TaxID=33203 RepID=A0ACC4DNY0_PURLI
MERQWSLDEVALHNHAEDCWMAIHGKVYDVTAFVPIHPGGQAILLRNAGQDATASFDSVHPIEILDEYVESVQIMGALLAKHSSADMPPDSASKSRQHAGNEEDLATLVPLEQMLSLPEMEASALRQLSPKARHLQIHLLASTGLCGLHVLRSFHNDSRRERWPANLGITCGYGEASPPSGERGIAAACSTFNALQIISKNASISVPSIVGAGAQSVYAWQLYVLKDISATERTLAQIRAIPQIRFIVLTLDAPFPGKREADVRFKMGEMAGSSPPQVWGTEGSLTWRRTLNAMRMRMQPRSSPSVKGIILSNHGGRALDTAPSPVQVLLEIRKFCPQVLDKVEVMIDGGIRRGTDVVKALALGAKAVGIGRAALYGLALAGQAGVERTLEILAEETMTAMRLLGVNRVSELGPRHISTAKLNDLLFDGEAGLDVVDRELGAKLMAPTRHERKLSLEEVEDMEQSPETYAAIMATNKPNPRGPGYLKLYMLASVIFLCSTMNGFDSALMGSINALPNYTSYFGLPETGNASTGLVFSIFQIGQMCGALFIWMSDWYGRTWHIFFGCLGVCIGTIVTSLSTSLPMLIGGRFILSFAATCAHTAAPLYLVEIAPAAYRGTVAGLYNTFYYVGSILATASVYACHKHLSGHGNLDWKIPLWLQMVCPGIVCLVIKTFPESPRWLVAKDRHEEAKAILSKYHANGDQDHPLVKLQMSEMIASMDSKALTWKDLFDLRVLFESRSSRYRIMLNITFSWFGQFSGNNIISYYLPIMLKGIGITSTDTALVLNIVYSVVGWVFASAGSRFHDVVGRRKMLIGSTCGMTVCLAIVAGCAAGYTDYKNETASTVSIVFIFLFGAIFSAGFTPMQPIYPAEVVSNKMRAKSMGVFKLTAGAAGFLNTFVGPIALSNIGYWFYVFFVGWDSLEVIFMYLFFVETKGMTLEELDVIFEAKNPRKESLRVKKILADVEVEKSATGAA